MKTRYYPAPDLDRAVYHLQNHPELAGRNTKDLQYVMLYDGRMVGRNAWERAKKVCAHKQEERHTITLDLTTRFITYIGTTTRLVTLAKNKALLQAKLDMLATRGYVKVHTSTDKKFFVFKLPAEESKVAA